MSKNIVVGSLGIVLLSGIIVGVNLDRENKELHKLVEEQSEIINSNQKEISEYIKSVDDLNQQIKSKNEVIDKKDARIGELKKEVKSKQEEIDKLKKKKTPLGNVSRGEVSNKRQLNMEVTAYVSTCNGCSGITYSGHNVRNTIYYQGFRVIAANFNKLPLYSIVRIDTDNQSYKAIVLDTGGAIRYSNTVDLLVGSYEEAIQFGRKQATITVLREGKG